MTVEEAADSRVDSMIGTMVLFVAVSTPVELGWLAVEEPVGVEVETVF